jgi:transcriptional regulator with XRE-family HTH domain
MTSPQVVAAPVGLVLKSYRLRRGWSQERLGNNAGLGEGTLPQIEQGRRLPTIDTIRRLLVELRVDWKTFGEDMHSADPIAFDESQVLDHRKEFPREQHRDAR